MLSQTWLLVSSGVWRDDCVGGCGVDVSNFVPF